MKPIRVAPDRWNFQTSDGAFISPLGGNILDDQHPGQGTLFQNFDASDCDRRLGLMSELGLNCLRQAIGVNEVFDAQGGGGMRADGLHNWDTFIALAQKHGIYLMPVGGYIGGNDWFDVERLADSGRALDESCAFWAAFCAHYAGHPAIWAWDLRNELLYDDVQHMVAPGSPDAARVGAMLLDGWPAFLRARYGDAATMNRVYGGASYGSFEEVPASIHFEEAPFDARANDVRHYLNERGYAWCKAQCEVIRAAAPGHMVCSGNNTWLSPDQDLWLANGFHNRAVHDLFDFISHHPYPALQCLPEYNRDPLDDVAQDGPKWRFWRNCCIGMSRLEFYGKPVVLQEWGWYGGGESRFLNDLPFRSEEEHAFYSAQLMDALAPHVNGFINWPTFDMPLANDISNHGGIWTHNGKEKKLAAVYRDWGARTSIRRERKPADTTLVFSLLGLYTARGVQDDMWRVVDETLASGATPDFRFV